MWIARRERRIPAGVAWGLGGIGIFGVLVGGLSPSGFWLVLALGIVAAVAAYRDPTETSE